MHEQMRLLQTKQDLWIPETVVNFIRFLFSCSAISNSMDWKTINFMVTNWPFVGSETNANGISRNGQRHEIVVKSNRAKFYELLILFTLFSGNYITDYEMNSGQVNLGFASYINQYNNNPLETIIHLFVSYTSNALNRQWEQWN